MMNSQERPCLCCHAAMKEEGNTGIALKHSRLG